MSLEVEYITPKEILNEDEEHKRLVKFVSLISQVGFKDFCLNPNTQIKIDYCN